MKDWKFWLQILISTIIPLGLGSGLIFVLSQFKERLPDWAYGFIITIIYVAFIIVLAVLIIILIQVAFGGLFTRLHKWLKGRSERKVTRKLIDDWLDKLWELRDLIRDVDNNNWQATKKQGHSYMRLHMWFKLRRSKFLPYWQDFQRRRTTSANVGKSFSTNDLEYVTLDEHDKDPFSVFYEPMAIEELRQSLSRWGSAEIKYVLTKLYDLTLEFIAWTLSR